MEYGDWQPYRIELRLASPLTEWSICANTRLGRAANLKRKLKEPSGEAGGAGAGAGALHVIKFA